MPAARPARLEVGEVVRPHGLKGDVVVRLDSDQPERLAVGATLETDAATLVVRTARALKDRFVVGFEGVDSIEAAEALRGTVLSAAPLDKAGVLWVDELLGASVRSRDGEVLGTVAGVEANPASDLLVLDTGALIPTHFIVGDLDDGAVTVDVPEGLV
ncbi:MAG TPA: ribosome maturation factor RimM [Acidimicrobiales bacterium]|nr:ribosome maturation factor RimM [Acidimicrobiales bacterium]